MTDNTSQDSQHPDAGAVPVRLVRGDASPEELAAVLAILAAASGDGTTEAPVRHTSRWSTPQRLVRTPHTHGPGGWRASALPR